VAVDVIGRCYYLRLGGVEPEPVQLYLLIDRYIDS